MMILNGEKIKALIILNMPRLTFTTTMSCIMQSVLGLDFELMTTEGVYWEQAITSGMETNKDVEYLLFVDYDSVFTKDDLIKLFALMQSDKTIDAIYPVQVARHNNQVLCWHPDTDYSKQPVADSKFGHFGLSIIRKSVFNNLPKPWVNSRPNADGEWKDGKVDADISFWELLAKHNKRVVVATDVIIGHMDIYVKWPRGNSSISLQYIRDYLKSGKPQDAHFGIQPGKESVKIENRKTVKPTNSKTIEPNKQMLFKPLVSLPLGL